LFVESKKMNLKNGLSIDQMRLNYSAGQLDIDHVAADPISQFKNWFNQAIETCPVDWFEVNGATLATSDQAGDLSARIVLVKGIHDDGVVFFTNYDSEKGRHLKQNPKAALVFWWPFLQRQVRLTGTVSLTSPEESTQYFHSRPIGSQIGAVISPQSQVLKDRSELEEKMQVFASTVGDSVIPRPENWGGYLVTLNRAEFWRGRENRLHDRINYRLDPNGRWIIERLAP